MPQRRHLLLVHRAQLGARAALLLQKEADLPVALLGRLLRRILREQVAHARQQPARASATGGVAHVLRDCLRAEGRDGSVGRPSRLLRHHRREERLLDVTQLDGADGLLSPELPRIGAQPARLLEGVEGFPLERLLAEEHTEVGPRLEVGRVECHDLAEVAERRGGVVELEGAYTATVGRLRVMRLDLESLQQVAARLRPRFRLHLERSQRELGARTSAMAHVPRRGQVLLLAR
mmetsp:Transcript_12051/g.31638  ORF Transcript_12051/g.31638 Transcript_12051/m.31638 type:complete len:234 (-) Transcript_12051:166-867(-)